MPLIWTCSYIILCKNGFETSECPQVQSFITFVNTYSGNYENRKKCTISNQNVRKSTWRVCYFMYYAMRFCFKVLSFLQSVRYKNVLGANFYIEYVLWKISLLFAKQSNLQIFAYLHRRCFCGRFHFILQNFVWYGHNLLNDCMNLTSFSIKNRNYKVVNFGIREYERQA